MRALAINDGVEGSIGPHGPWMTIDDLLRVAKWRARTRLRGEAKRDEMERTEIVGQSDGNSFECGDGNGNGRGRGSDGGSGRVNGRGFDAMRREPKMKNNKIESTGGEGGRRWVAGGRNQQPGARKARAKCLLSGDRLS